MNIVLGFGKKGSVDMGELPHDDFGYVCKACEIYAFGKFHLPIILFKIESFDLLVQFFSF